MENRKFVSIWKNKHWTDHNIRAVMTSWTFSFISEIPEEVEIEESNGNTIKVSTL